MALDTYYTEPPRDDESDIQGAGGDVAGANAPDANGMPTPEARTAGADIEDTEFRYSTPDSDNGEDDANEDGGDETSQRPHSHPMLLMLKVLANPMGGWRALSAAAPHPEEVARGCAYPMMALAAACCFMQFYYDPHAELSEVLMKAVITFMSYFIGYFFVELVSKALPRSVRGRVCSPFGRCFMLTAIATLALFAAVRECLEAWEPVLVFLPLYTAYLVYRGTKALRVPEDRRVGTGITLAVLILTAPHLIFWLLEAALPVV